MNFRTRIVAVDNGSLPNGGVAPNTPIYAVENTFLDTTELTAQDPIDLSWPGKLAFMIDDVLSPTECARLIALTEQLGFSDAAPGIQTPPGMRQNKTVHWLANSEDVDRIFARIADKLPQEIEGQRLSSGLSHRFNTYRYTKGQQFRPHLDGDWPGFGLDETGQEMETWKEGLSMLSMLLYLNGEEEGVVGGETLLFEGQSIQKRVQPKAGRALFFRHGLHMDSVVHAGDLLLSDQPKYVVRVNVMYERAA